MVMFESKDNPTKAASRCGFLHSIVQIIASGFIDESEIIVEEENTPRELELKKTFRVRVQRIGTKETKLSSPEIERKLANFVGRVFEGLKLEVNLSNPDYRFIAFVHKNQFFLGIELWSVDRNEYREREPGKRPSFRPGSMKTDFARALVNLSRIREGETFYDPFCGGGGLLIEASVIGAYTIGSDISAEAISSSKINMRKFGRNAYSIIRGDSRTLSVKTAQGIATDPPYSIQSSTHGETVSELISDFLIESKTILEPERYLVFSCPSQVKPEKLAQKADYEIVSMIDTRIHKSLTRRIMVIK